MPEGKLFSEVVGEIIEEFAETREEIQKVLLPLWKAMLESIVSGEFSSEQRKQLLLGVSDFSKAREGVLGVFDNGLNRIGSIIQKILREPIKPEEKESQISSLLQLESQLIGLAIDELKGLDVMEEELVKAKQKISP